jgi:hypothetical protein
VITIPNDGPEAPELLDTKALAEYLEKRGFSIHPTTLATWRIQVPPRGPRAFKLGARVVYARADADGWVEEQKRAPSDSIIECLDGEIAAAFQQALPALSRQLPHAVPMLGAVLKYDVAARVQEQVAALLRGATSVRFDTHAPRVGELEVAYVAQDAITMRNARRAGLRLNNGDLGAAGREIIDWQGFKLLEGALPLPGGVVTLSAKSPKAFRIRRGSRDSLFVYGPSLPWSRIGGQDYGRGLTFASRMIVEGLARDNDEFRDALSRDIVRIVDDESQNGDAK